MNVFMEKPSSVDQASMEKEAPVRSFGDASIGILTRTPFPVVRVSIRVRG